MAKGRGHPQHEQPESVHQKLYMCASAVPSRVDANSSEVKMVCKTLEGARSPWHPAAGTIAFGLLLYITGAAPWLLPSVFLLFVAICIPWRAASFCTQKWHFFLIDFCYFVNVVTAIYLLWYPQQPAVGLLVYALADGPLAGALVAWQCSWVMDSNEHTVSVLMHLLPGLAVFAHRYHTPDCVKGWRNLARYYSHDIWHGRVQPAGPVSAPGQPDATWFWLTLGPLLFYLAWQLLYFLTVQVACRGLIKRGGYDTSYNCLARRAAKTNNFWNRLVRRGSIMRRITMYGFVQLCYTVIALTVFLPVYLFYPLGVIYQVLKFFFPVYYGAKYTAHKVPKHIFLEGLQLLNTAMVVEGALEMASPAQRGAALPASKLAGKARTQPATRGPLIKAAAFSGLNLKGHEKGKAHLQKSGYVEHFIPVGGVVSTPEYHGPRQRRH